MRKKTFIIGLLADLKKAGELINTAANPIAGDLVYGGNLTKWKKFANSLRLRIALRIADKDPANGKNSDCRTGGGSFAADCWQ